MILKLIEIIKDDDQFISCNNNCDHKILEHPYKELKYLVLLPKNSSTNIGLVCSLDCAKDYEGKHNNRIIFELVESELTELVDEKIKALIETPEEHNDTN